MELGRGAGVFASAILLSAMALGSASHAADLPVQTVDPLPPAPTDLPLPAVSGLNGKFAILGGGTDAGAGNDGGTIGAQGSVSVPLGHRFGFQADGYASWVSGDAIFSGAGHLFWRDPSIGLVGAYGGAARNDLVGFDSLRFGIEGEAYLGRVSVEALLGWEGIDYDTTGDEDNVFALADIAFYMTDDLRFSAGYRHWNEIHMAAFGTEYQLPMRWGGSGAVLFAEGRVGEDDYRAIWGGVRFYIGAEPKSLIRRHREDDPRLRDEDQAGMAPARPAAALSPQEQCNALGYPYFWDGESCQMDEEGGGGEGGVGGDGGVVGEPT